MQLVQIKRLGPGKFYLSHKGDHSFIKGNPSSHKGWMSRFFFVKCNVMRDPWKCEMHWRDSAVTLVPRTPDRAPSLTPFLEAMHGKSYSAPELIREDLLCFYKFSRKGVELVGDLDERMARTEEASQPKQAPRPPTPSSEEALDVPPVTATAGGPSSGKGLEQPPPFDPSKDSLIESPCPVAATIYLQYGPGSGCQDIEEGPQYGCGGSLLVVAWGGEMVKRLTKAHQKINASRDQFDKAMGQHAEVLARLEELKTLRSREKEAAEAQREALEAQMLVEKEAHEAEKAAREMLEAELEEVKSRAARDAECLKLEGKEEFLKSPEFDTLLGKKAGGFFKNGFFGCVAQWRANGYPEEEHPASFLNVQQAIAEMPDEEEVQEEEEDEDEEEGGNGSEATPPSSPLS
ncbi:hypothetical protein F511_23770 [Dorcoceras hygrometricum]|uniref:Uncharacterized protein n=1 Tax=Dorcoceras hygrometricum TaxID=472368 RepID=A0A2Z7B646_9LAMI|nr:hypothetical protein F511_23770 [Dorcoceras hygrometricum]